MCSSPIPVWFVCKSCEDSFTHMSRFIDHKKDKHFSEFQNIKFIVFEETRRDQNENLDPTQESTQESESSIVKEKLAFIESIPVPLPKLRLVKRNSELFHIVDKAPAPVPEPEPEQNYLPSTNLISSPSNEEDEFIGVTPTTPLPFLPDLLHDEQDVHIIKTEGGLENNNETEKNNMTSDLFHSNGEFLQHVNVDLANNVDQILDSTNAIIEIDSDAVFDFQGGLIFQKSNKNSSRNSGENYDDAIPYLTSTTSSVFSVPGDDDDSDSDNDPHLDPALQPITELIIYTGENPDTEAADPLQEISPNTNPNNLPLPLKVKKLTNSKTKRNAKKSSNNKPTHNHNPFVFLTRLTSKEIQDFAPRIQNVQRNQNRNRPKKLPLKLTSKPKPKPKLIPNPQLFGCKFCSKKYKRQPRLKMHIKICKSRNKKSSKKAKQTQKSQSKSKPPRQRKSKSALKVKVANQPKPKISSAPTNPLVLPRSTFVPMIASKIVQTSGGATVVQKKSYICSICQQVCSSPTTLRNHFATHSELRPYSCAQLNCEKAFKTKKSLYNHENHVHSGTKIFICPQKGCSKSFPARNLLIQHRSSQHKHGGKIQAVSRINKKKTKKCLDKTQCNKNKTKLSSSEKKCLTLPKRPAPRGQVPESFKCHICNKEFPWKAYLRNHLLLMHSTTTSQHKGKHSNSQGDRSTTTLTSSAAGKRKRKRKSVVPVDV